MPDVQSLRPRRVFKLSRVGVTRVRKPIQIERSGVKVTLSAEIDVGVDLPATQKGSHLSRNIEVIESIVDQSVRTPQKSLEALCIKVASTLLERHDYATYAQILIEADYFIERSISGFGKSLEPYRIKAGVCHPRNGKPTKMIGVEVIGMTVCPCAMEEVRSILTKKHPDCKELLEKIPVPSHNQRNIAMMELTSPFSAPEVDADDLIDILEQALSAPTHGLLKRKEEGELVYKAFTNPRFVEDVAREALDLLLVRFPNLPDDVEVLVRSKAEESIHKYEAFAERVATVGELRE